MRAERCSGRPRRWHLAAVGALAGGLVASSAGAHGGLASGMTPFFEDGALVGAWTSYGVLRVADGAAAWTAEESLETVMSTLRYAGASRLLAGTARGAFATTDWGCTWEPVNGALGSTSIGQIWTDPLDPSHAFAFTDAALAPVTLYESHDRGVEWEATDASFDGNFVSSFALPGMSQLWLLLDAETGLELWRSDDGAESWELLSVDLGQPVLVKLLGPTGEGDGIYLTETLIETSSTAARLLRVDIDADEPAIVATLPGVTITSFASLGAELFLSVDRTSTFRVAGEPSEAQRLPGTPEICPGSWFDPDRLWACGLLTSGRQFLSSTDGVEWTPELGFAPVCPAACPSGTPGDVANTAIWRAVYRSGVGNLSCAPADDPEDAGAGGAGTVGGAGQSAGAPSVSGNESSEPESDAGLQGNGGSATQLPAGKTGCACRATRSSDKPLAPWLLLLACGLLRRSSTRIRYSTPHMGVEYRGAADIRDPCSLLSRWRLVPLARLRRPT